MRRIASAFVLLLMFPLLVSGQAFPAVCGIDRSLKRGDSGPDVTALQQFLAGQGYFNHEPTGYFGLLTQAALIEFQLETDIITAAIDGGVYGPRTRAYVHEHFCLTGSVIPGNTLPTNQCPATPIVPTSPPCTGTWTQIMDTNSCHVGWSCSEQSEAPTNANPNPNQPPLINAILGPTTVKVNESRAWNISASDPENGQLAYSIVWGDEGVSLAELLILAGQGTNFSPIPSFTHSYAQSGTYTIVAFTRDNAGKTAKATLSVTVQSSLPSNTNPNTGGQNTCSWSGRTYAQGDTFTPTYESGECPIETRWDPLKCGRITYRCDNGNWIETVGGNTVGQSCQWQGKTYAQGEILEALVDALRLLKCANGTWYDARNNNDVCKLLAGTQWAPLLGCTSGTQGAGNSCYFQGQPYPDGATGPCPQGVIFNNQCIITGTVVWPFKNVCRNGAWMSEPK